MEFTCAACGRRHIREQSTVDEHIHCECGFDFFAFYQQGLAITVPWEEAGNVAGAFKRFVASTGRGPKLPSEENNISQAIQNVDPRALIEAGLERYQAEVLGKVLLKCGDIFQLRDE